MALFLIERNFAEQLETEKADWQELKRINGEEGIEWLYSFLSADKKKTYCLYEAPDVEAIRTAAQRFGIPADVIVSVSELQPAALA